MATAWARRRRQRFEADTRPNWRDPNMGVWLWAESWNDGAKGWRFVAPEVVSYAANIQMQTGVTIHPPWQRDPSYNWRRRR